MSKIYGPDIRISEKQNNKIKNKKDNIPNPKTNPIVVNNIASMEFDYTEKPYK